MLEKHLEAKVRRLCNRKRILCYKFVSPANPGVPDRILVFPSGIVAFLELKREGQKPTTLQNHEMDKLRRNNANVFWSDSWLSITTWIDDLSIL